MTDDPGMQDMLKFLIARDTMHQQQWLAVLEELPKEAALNAPGDYGNEPEYEQYAYTFFNHLADGQLPADMRPVSGPSLDGRGQFTQAVTPPVAGQEPELQKAPADAHAGPESTAPDGGGVMGQVTGSLRGAIDKITPGS
jgi:Mn-containing catalase